MANKNLKGFIQEVFANIDLGDFDMDAIPEIELNETFIEEFHKKYLTATSAKNNPDIINHFKARYLSTVDNKLKKALGDEKFEELQEGLEDKDTLKLMDAALEHFKAEAKKDPIVKTDNKEFENYKKQTIKEIQDLKQELENAQANDGKAVQEERQKWVDRYKQSRINEILGGMKFNNTLPPEDFKLLVNQKLASSDKMIMMDDEFNFKIVSKDDPEIEIVKEGKALQIEDLLTEYSRPYLAKNNEGAEGNEGNGNEGGGKRKMNVDVNVGKDDKDDGYFTPGHPNYKGALSKTKNQA